MPKTENIPNKIKRNHSSKNSVKNLNSLEIGFEPSGYFFSKDIEHSIFSSSLYLTSWNLQFKMFTYTKCTIMSNNHE